MNAITDNTLTRRTGGSGGFALLMVLLLIATAAVVGVSYIQGAQVKTASTGNLMLAAQARYLAESGLQHGLYSLQTRAISFGSEAVPNGPYHVESGDGGYVFYITATANPQDYRITATGSEGGISQTVSMTVRLNSQYAEKMAVVAGLTYWWRLGDAGFTAVDEKGRVDGTYVNGVTRGATGAIFGDPNTAAEFRGSNDYVNLGAIARIDNARATFGCWVRADAWSHSYARIMSRSTDVNTTDRYWQLSMNGVAHKLRFSLRVQDTYYDLVGATPLELGQWYFVVATFDKNVQQMRLYLNGEPDGTQNNTLMENIKDDDAFEAWIGDCPPVPGQRPWAGPIDEVFIIKDRTMTADKVKELYDASIPGVEVISWDD